jgi:mono/diheme cytochrome c family protein
MTACRIARHPTVKQGGFTVNKLCRILILAAATTAALPAWCVTNDTALVARGRYLTATAGCNDCHTARYGETGGSVPESERLTGVPVGFNGPWGTSYASNLRLVAQQMNEQQWLAAARAPRRPPMPWFALRDMTDSDVKAIYAYLRSLGPAGRPMPAALPPGETPKTPYIVFVPQAPAAGSQVAAR